MALFIRTDKDTEGKLVRVENGFKAADGKYYLLLFRLPPEYAKPPLFLVELSTDVVQVRDDSADARQYYKAYAHQGLTEKETRFLCGCKPGKPVLPFLNFSYPTVIRVLGKQFTCLTGAEIAPIVSRHQFKLVGGTR